MNLAMCDMIVGEQTLTRGCRMSHDPQLYYNPNAMALPVVRDEGSVLTAYEGTKADDDGQVIWYPDYDERERIQMEYYTCLSKALDDQPECDEQCLVLLAGYCQKARLEEEACVMRTHWDRRFRQLSLDVIRKVFREIYKKPYNGRTLSQMNEKERIIRFIEDFFARRYQLRYNVVKQMTEFRSNDLTFKPWEPLTDRQLKSIVVEQMKEGGESWMNDIRIYIESAHVEDYNPVHEFLAGCGEWDRKADYIEDFARRLPTNYKQWPKYFHRWFLAMVAQALDINRDYGNSMVPMLIGGQGIKKSNFCKNILPPSMREYYMDDIKMDNAEQVERVLGRMWLVCIDEYNAKTDREQAKIKRLLTEKDVQIRKMRSDQYTMTPRLCSFIATTNDPTPLPSGDGSRRYLCVEVTGQVDMSGRIPYKQMFAQAVHELNRKDCIYWFTSEDEQEIQEHNRQYQNSSSTEQVLQSLFEPSKTRTKDCFWQVQTIQKELENHLKSSDVPNLKILGETLKRLRWPRGGISGIRGYYLKLKQV
jgi:predicted P-loop ATPase